MSPIDTVLRLANLKRCISGQYRHHLSVSHPIYSASSCAALVLLSTVWFGYRLLDSLDQDYLVPYIYASPIPRNNCRANLLRLPFLRRSRPYHPQGIRQGIACARKGL